MIGIPAIEKHSILDFGMVLIGLNALFEGYIFYTT
jgi:hypothetical protein